MNQRYTYLDGLRSFAAIGIVLGIMYFDNYWCCNILPCI